MTQCRTLTLAIGALLLTTAAGAQTAAPLYRVFLADGSSLTSYGEWARLEDRLIFSMPTTPGAGPGELHLVALPLDRVDLPRTERYADAVRAQQYAATRGEADFAALSTSVAQTLNQVALLPDPKQRLRTAQQARRALTEWPGAQFGYRDEEVREILGVLDEVISGLRASAGESGFELELSAHTVAPPPEPLLAAPDHTQTAEHLMAAAALVESPAEKVSLLQSVLALLDRAVDYLPASVAAALRARALGDIAEEERIDSAYAALRTSVLDAATRDAERADVRALEGLRAKIDAEDQALGRKRPAAVAGLVATLEAHLDAARRLRLAQDQWELGERAMRAYRRAAVPFIQRLIDARRNLEDIKLQAGPAPQRLHSLERQIDRNARQLRLLEPPPHLAAIHAVFLSAFTLAQNAVQLRRDAVQAADLDLASQAAAAASGALLLLERARADLRAAAQPPIPLRASSRP